MKLWNELTHYAGFDWARDHHQVVIVDRQGQIVAQWEFDHSLEGWTQWRKQIADYPAVAVVIETNQGAAVEQLLQSQLTVYPINPRSAKAYRQRKVTTSNKTDRLDAWSLAEALRTDGQQWRPLLPLDPLVQELRLLCRDELQLIGQRTALINQLQAALSEYYPAALQAFDDWTLPASWKFLERFPTPQALAKVGPRKWENFLHCHKLYRPQTQARRMEAFRHATEFCGSPAVTRAKSMLVLSLVKLLKVLEDQLEEYRAEIEKLFARHPDHDLFGSLPGGQVHKVYMRRQCNKHLRGALHHWANLSRRTCQWAQVYYQQLRQRGKSHAQALRCLGHRWLKILWKMWQTRTAYDPELHTRNQTAHGSWVLQLIQAQPGE
jgi:transposase